MVLFIDDHREVYGVEPICRVLPIAPSTYYEQKAREKDPRRLPPRLAAGMNHMAFATADMTARTG